RLRGYRQTLFGRSGNITWGEGLWWGLLAGERRRVWVVGDAIQAIYIFRGASPANIANFRDDYPEAIILPLSRNYRSRPDIVSLADAFRCTQLEPEAQPGAVQTARSVDLDTYIT